MCKSCTDGSSPPSQTSPPAAPKSSGESRCDKGYHHGTPLSAASANDVTPPHKPRQQTLHADLNAKNSTLPTIHHQSYSQRPVTRPRPPHVDRGHISGCGYASSSLLNALLKTTDGSLARCLTHKTWSPSRESWGEADSDREALILSWAPARRRT